MPDTLANFESNSIPSSRAAVAVNGHLANRQASKTQPVEAAVRSAGDGCEALELWRQLQIAEEKLNATIEDADDALVEAYHEAQDRFTDSHAASREGVLLKLLRIEEVEGLDGQLEDMPRLLWPRLLRSAIRDLKVQVGSEGISAPEAGMKPHAAMIPALHTPSGLLCQILDAARRPLKKEDYPAARAALVKALTPMIGHYTVADAVFLLGQLRVAISTMPGTTAEGKDCPDFNTMCMVGCLLEDFASTVDASGPICASARAALFERSEKDDEWNVGPSNQTLIAAAILRDTKDARLGQFRGDIFSVDQLGPGDLSWLERVERAEAAG